MIIQFCGLSGAGKSTLAKVSALKLQQKGYAVEILDGDEYRNSLCSDLSFSKRDRCENIRRLAIVASKLSGHGIISIICAINPYDEVRKEIAMIYKRVFLVHIDCSLDTVVKRDTKGLYKRALLPHQHPDKIMNLTGVSDLFEAPLVPDVYVNTDKNNIEECGDKITRFIIENHHQHPSTKKSTSKSGISGTQPCSL
jgi:adenylylsulfate kinase